MSSMNLTLDDDNGTPRVGFIGECMIELQSSGDKQFRQGFAGDTLNTAVYFSRLAQSQAMTHFCSAVGNDSFSHEMLDFWHKERIDTTFVRSIAQRQPGLYIVEIDENGERTFQYWRGESAAKFMFSGEEFDRQWQQLSKLDYIYLSGISIAILPEKDREKLLSYLLKAKKSGTQICFDNNFREKLWPNLEQARHWYSRFLAVTDLACLTFDDEQALWNDLEVQQTFERCKTMGITEIVLKRGTQPCLIQTPQQFHSVAAVRLESPQIVDTNAAGDSFSAGYLAARLVDQQSAESSANFAHRVASKVIQHRGAIIPAEHLPKIKEICTFVE